MEEIESIDEFKKLRNWKEEKRRSFQERKHKQRRKIQKGKEIVEKHSQIFFNNNDDDDDEIIKIWGECSFNIGWNSVKKTNQFFEYVSMTVTSHSEYPRLEWLPRHLINHWVEYIWNHIYCC